MMPETAAPNVALVGDLIHITDGGESIYLTGASVRALAPSLFALCGVSIALTPGLADDERHQRFADLDADAKTHFDQWAETFAEIGKAS